MWNFLLLHTAWLKPATQQIFKWFNYLNVNIYIKQIFVLFFIKIFTCLVRILKNKYMNIQGVQNY